MANETAFIPGPWTIALPCSGFSEIRGPNGELIFGLAAGGSEEKQPDEVCDANAALIKAAPDLYEALKYLTRVPNRLSGEQMARAQKALSRARGDR